MHSTVTVNGAQIAYRFDGPANGRVVLMSNSLMSNYDMWDPTVPALSDRYRVLRYDTRGHGRSSTPPGPYSIAMLADDAAGLLDALGIGSAHFVGLSMGGMVGQQLAARHPDRVHSLALCDTASEMPPREMWEQRLAAARSQGVPGLADSTLQRWFTEPFLRRAPGEVEKVRRMILSTGAEGYMACAAAIRDMAQTTMLLSITAPTLVLTGRQDPATTLAHATVLHRVIAGSRLVIVEDAAHLSNIEQPEAFNAALRGFIDEVDARLAPPA